VNKNKGSGREKVAHQSCPRLFAANCRYIDLFYCFRRPCDNYPAGTLVIPGTIAINELNRRDVVYLGKKISELAVSGLRQDVIHKNNPEGFVCREVVHSYKSSRSIFHKTPAHKTPYSSLLG
jgi:hypothetical protein